MGTMKKLDKARFYRNGYKAMRDALMKDIVEVLMEHADNELLLDDHRGSLCYNTIDEQECEVIQSIYLKYGKDGEGKVAARVGVYEPDYDVNVDDMDIEMVLNVMDAVERAENEDE
jgi:hypothetical protein